MPVTEAEAEAEAGADGRIVGEAVDLVRLEAQVPPAVTSFSIELPVFSAKRTWRAEAVMRRLSCPRGLCVDRPRIGTRCERIPTTRLVGSKYRYSR